MSGVDEIYFNPMWDIRMTDTSLRDGSHHKRHQFTLDEVGAIVAALDTAGVPVIEVTHGDGLGGSSLNYGLSKTPEQELIKLAAQTAKEAKIAFLMLPGVGTKEDIKEAQNNGGSICRIATHCTEADVSIQHFGLARELGLETVGFLMMSHTISPEKLAAQARIMADAGCQCVYVVDSAGALVLEGVAERVAALVAELGDDAQVGFHGHENLGLGVVAQLGDKSRDPVGDTLEDQRPGGVHDIDALAAGIGHDPGLLGELLRRDGVRHHQEPDRLEAELAGQPEVLNGHVGLGAVGGDPADRATVVLRLLDVLLGAHPWQHEERDLGLLGRLGRELDQLLLRRFRESVVEARPAEPVTVRDLDDRNTRRVEGRDDGTHLVLGELMTLVMGPVAQRRVGHPDIPHGVEENIGAHACAPSDTRLCLAISSPTLVAAAVMMSRFPAYGGK